MIIGTTLAERVRFGSAVFAVLAFIAIVAGLSHYDLVVDVLVAVTVGLFLVSMAFGVAERSRRDENARLGGPEDLDRPGGRYDALHGRTRIK